MVNARKHNFYTFRLLDIESSACARHKSLQFPLNSTCVSVAEKGINPPPFIILNHYEIQPQVHKQILCSMVDYEKNI